MLDFLFFNSKNKNWKITSAVKSDASLRHKASISSFIGSRAHISSLRSKNSAVDMSCSIDKSSTAFDIHFYRNINLSIISYIELQRVLQPRTSENSMFCSNNTYHCKTLFFTGLLRYIFSTFPTFLSSFSIPTLITGTLFEAVEGITIQNLLHAFLYLDRRSNRNLYLQYGSHFCITVN